MFSFSDDVKTENAPFTSFTSHPIYVVKQTRRVYGIDTGLTNDIVYLNDEGDECEKGAHRICTGYLDLIVWVQPFFTRQGAERYIEENDHNLSHPRVFVESGYRNSEWQEVRKMALASGDEEELK